jgi:hypothetical protein
MGEKIHVARIEALEEFERRYKHFAQKLQTVLRDIEWRFGSFRISLEQMVKVEQKRVQDLRRQLEESGRGDAVRDPRFALQEAEERLAALRKAVARVMEKWEEYIRAEKRVKVLAEERAPKAGVFLRFLSNRLRAYVAVSPPGEFRAAGLEKITTRVWTSYISGRLRKCRSCQGTGSRRTVPFNPERFEYCTSPDLKAPCGECGGLGLVEESSDPPPAWLEVVPPKFREAVERAFEGTPQVVTLQEDLIAYRHWGGGAQEEGSPWLSPEPYTCPEEARNRLALPPENTAEHISIFKIPAGTTIIRGKAAAQDEDFPYIVGGGEQIYLPDPSKAILIGPFGYQQQAGGMKHGA